MTPAKAKLQVWGRGIIGVLLAILGVFWLFIILAKPGISYPWEAVEYAVYTMILMGTGVFMLKSAKDRHAQIKQTQQGTEREAPSPGESLQLVPPEPWHKRGWGTLVLGLVVTVMGGLIVELIKLLLLPAPSK